jgi:hypothetical protein
VQSYGLIPFVSRRELDSSGLLERQRIAWTHQIERLAPVITGQLVPSGLSADEGFINSLRALMTVPVSAVRDELERRRQGDRRFEQELVTWMVEEQG